MQRAVYTMIAEGPRVVGPRHFEVVDSEGHLQGPFNAMVLAPGVGGVLQELGSAIRYRSSMSNRVRELAILRVASLRRSAFEAYAHEAAGRWVGLTQEQLKDVRHGRLPNGLEPEEYLTLEVVDDLLRHRDLDEVRFKDAVELLGQVALIELVFLVGYYDLLALSLRVWRTPLPAGVPDPFGAKHEDPTEA